MSKEVPSCREDMLNILPYLLHGMKNSNEQIGTSYDIFNNEHVREAMLVTMRNYFSKSVPFTAEGIGLGPVECAANLQYLEKVITTFDFNKYIITQIKLEAIALKHNLTSTEQYTILQ